MSTDTPAKNLTDLMKTAEAIVRDMFNNRELVEDDCITPVWTLLTEEGKIYVYMTPFFNANDKDAVAVLMKKKIEELKAIAYTFVSETWVVHTAKKIDKETAEEMAKNIVPCEHPDRRDTVLIIGEDMYGQSISWDINIEDGRVLNTETQIHTMRAVSVSGRFTDMFGERKVSAN